MSLQRESTAAVEAVRLVSVPLQEVSCPKSSFRGDVELRLGGFDRCLQRTRVHCACPPVATRTHADLEWLDHDSVSMAAAHAARQGKTKGLGGDNNTLLTGPVARALLNVPSRHPCTSPMAAHCTMTMQ